MIVYILTSANERNGYNESLETFRFENVDDYKVEI